MKATTVAGRRRKRSRIPALPADDRALARTAAAQVRAIKRHKPKKEAAD